ncbi:MAG: thiamine biosynthesis protein ThiS [Opitutae bacterium]|nr:thiamine biosynthesis protein ThiS [Opitutae bacterium]
MKVLVNDNPREVPDTADLFHLLSEIGIEKQKGVAVAVNGTIVPNSIWTETELHANDQVLVVQATQGG